MHLTNMPPEMFYEILYLLHPKILLTCSTVGPNIPLPDDLLDTIARKVSRAWHETIVRSPALQYAIRLWKDGLLPGDSGSSSSTDMLRALDRRRQAWANLAWTSRTVVEIPPLSTCKAFDISGGVFAMQMQGPDFCTLSLRDLDVDGNTESLLRRQGLGIDAEKFEDFTLDPTQDLIASFHQSSPGEGTLVFQTISGRQHHPLARCPVVSFPIDTQAPVLSYIQIADDVVGAAIFEDGCSTLRVWSWRTGEHMARLPECDSPYPDSQFLSPRAFVQAVPCGYGHIEVYMIDTNETGVSDFVPVAMLELPDLAVDHDLTFIGMHCGPTCPHPMPRRPFSSAFTRRIYLFHLEYVSPAGSLHIRLFVPHRTLYGYVSRYEQERLTAPVEVPWEDWGPQHTRMLPGDEYGWTGHVHGERVVLPADDGGRKCIHLLDFSPIFPGQPEIVEDSQTSDTRTAFVSEPTTINGTFEEPVTTSLLYRSTMRSMDEDFDVLLLDQDHIIGMDSKEGKMTVFTF
ncbi:hypothetical protein FB45DRAFT_148267 [Roridomyces roridus]|uniref:F-box domain-containing protein n=1 Tax=Roridomyces roridus TaxID=1738132 RepID=A0AAD7BGA3_9AGAR|nr:hypothetical protein FB45DRAFT_148267 [Roridomyces roridus]